MAKSLFISPSSHNSGLTSVSLGLVRALDEIGVRVGFFKPITQACTSSNTIDLSVHFAKNICNIDCPPSISLIEAQAFLNRGEKGLLMEKVIGHYHSLKQNYDIPHVQIPTPAHLTNNIHHNGSKQKIRF